MEKYPDEPEMTEYESAALCGVIADIRPRKILEVGVAAGGSTAIIIECLESLKIKSSFISCDLNKKYYRDKKLNTGFLATKFKDNLKYVEHKFMLGAYLPEFLDEIGEDIDLAIIDTVHTAPGEILDFLAVLPFMKENGIVIFHDVAYSYYFKNSLCSNAILMASVVGNRIDMGNDTGRNSNYPNIGGFHLNSDTRKYIINTFSALLLDWEYMPPAGELDIYRKHYQKYYNAVENDLFEKAIYNNKENLRNRIYKKYYVDDSTIVNKIFDSEKEIIIYGKGIVANFWEEILLRNGIKIKYIIDEKGIGEEDAYGINVIHPKDIDFSRESAKIVIMSSKYDKEIQHELLYQGGYDNYCSYERFIRKVREAIIT